MTRHCGHVGSDTPPLWEPLLSQKMESIISLFLCSFWREWISAEREGGRRESVWQKEDRVQGRQPHGSGHVCAGDGQEELKWDSRDKKKKKSMSDGETKTAMGKRKACVSAWTSERKEPLKCIYVSMWWCLDMSDHYGKDWTQTSQTDRVWRRQNKRTRSWKKKSNKIHK